MSFFFFFLTPLAHANDITLFMEGPEGCTLSVAFCSALEFAGEAGCLQGEPKAK